MNDLLANKWDSLTGNALQDAARFVNVPPPKNILRALTKTCQGVPSRQPVGLLTALGYTNLINVKGAIDSPEVSNITARGKE